LKRDRAAVVTSSRGEEGTRLHDFAGLPGVKGGKLRGPMASSATGFMRALRQHRAVSAAGDHGSVMVWRDDAGKIRCSFMRHFRSIETLELSTKIDVRGWLIKWLPRMHEAPIEQRGAA
jgi:hypothetical protein